MENQEIPIQKQIFDDFLAICKKYNGQVCCSSFVEEIAYQLACLALGSAPNADEAFESISTGVKRAIRNINDLKEKGQI